MKRFFAILLALTMLLSLAACGGSTEPTDPCAAAPADTAEDTQPEETEAPPETTQGEESTAPAEAAILPGVLYQLDDDNPVVLGLALAGNRAGSDAFNNAIPSFEGIRCIFDLDEWVDVRPDTDAEDGLAVWVFRHKEDPKAYLNAALSEEADGFAAYCELPFDPDAEIGASRGSFYLNPEECEAGYYDLVFSLDGAATAVLLARFYNAGELEEKTDAELTQIMTGLN